MKKLIIASMLILLFSHQNFAQTSVSSKTSYWFCELVGKANLSGSRVSLELDMPLGSDSKQADEITKLKEKVASYSNMSEGMSYMSEQGWEFVQAYVLVQGDFNRYRWILKKIRN